MEHDEREELVVRAESVRDLAREAIGRADALRDTIDEMLDALRAPALPEPAELRPVAPRPVRPAQTPRPAPAADPRASLDTARLVAIEMAVAGRDRAEVRRHLRATYGLEDEALLDDVFGAEAPERRAGSV